MEKAFCKEKKYRFVATFYDKQLSGKNCDGLPDDFGTTLKLLSSQFI